MDNGIIAFLIILGLVCALQASSMIPAKTNLFAAG
jgi:hypothetical protein